jgi:uncharacterized protein (DUF58 family)
MSFFKSIYLNKIVFILLGISLVLFSFGLIGNVFFMAGKILLAIIFIVCLVETIILFRKRNIAEASRKLPIRLSNGDENWITITLQNNLSIALWATLIEDLPAQLQIRIWEKTIEIKGKAATEFQYDITPKTRGIYRWQSLHILYKIHPFGLISRKVSYDLAQETACYPSFDQFKKIPLKAAVSNFKESNSEHFVRKIGQSLEFEQIKEYSREDDYRHINWKASAKSGQLMLNQYQEERSQDIYCVLDMGRAMKMPFNQQSLLDYAVNASLALSKAVISMNDKAGILGLSHNRCDFLQAEKDMKQFGKINDFLYNISTEFLEADYELLYKFVRVNIRQRSLLVIFTNFDSVNSLMRQLTYLKALSKYHLVLVIFFENTEIAKSVKLKADNLKDIYTHTIGQNMLNQNRLISKELTKHGIQSIMIQPQNLNLPIINKFIEIKKRALI